MLLKDKYKPHFLDEFIINKNYANKCSKLVTKDFIPHILFHGPVGCGKYTLCKSIINNIYDEEIKTFNSKFKIENKEHTISCSEYHFEIFLDKYSNNKNCLFEIIDYLTDTKEINQVCLVKIIVLRNLNYCNSDLFSYLKNKMEVSSDNYRFFVTTNNVSYIPDRLRGLFFYVKLNYEEEKVIEEFLKYNNVKYDYKLLKSCRNMNIFFTKTELLNICKSKTFTELKEKQIIKLINDSINNPDNILKIRDILYEINIKNIKMIQILKNILSHFLKSKIDEDKKIKLCKMFAKYDHRVQMSYKSQIHYETLFMQVIYLLHS
jgi:DNA polymerase III delta prime subunit